MNSQRACGGARTVVCSGAVPLKRGGGMSPQSNVRTPVVFVHGLWLHAESWNNWVQLFRSKGYEAIAASWPGDSATTQGTRDNGKAVGGVGGSQTAHHIPGHRRALHRKPLAIEHWVAGRPAHNLL